MRSGLLGLCLTTIVALGPNEVRALEVNQAGSCVLTNGAQTAIQQALDNFNATLASKLVAPFKVDVIVIHSMANPNGGQQLQNCSPGVGALLHGAPRLHVPYGAERASEHQRPMPANTQIVTSICSPRKWNLISSTERM